jgi:uncharacterized damage-inducible protein DinB
MGTVDYFASSMKQMHGNFLDAVKDLTEDQFYFRPLDKGNHIAFLFWHLVRTEDLVLNFLVQGKSPIWNEQGWDKKLGMDPRSQGTGMSDADAAALKITDIQEFLKYTRTVFESSEAYVKTLTEEKLAEARDYGMLGKQSLYNVIGGITIHHGIGHLGETWYIKGLLGLKGSPM